MYIIYILYTTKSYVSSKEMTSNICFCIQLIDTANLNVNALKLVNNIKKASMCT